MPLQESSEDLAIFSTMFEPALLEELHAVSMRMSAKAGETMLDIGQGIQAVPLVLSGTFKVCRMNEEGQELLLYYVNCGESCAMTFTCCMMSKRSVIKAVAEVDGDVLCFPVKYMDAWLLKYPTWKNFVMNTILDRFSEILQTIDSVVFKKLDVRLEEYLRDKSKVTQSSLINLTHQQIADELGTSRVVISRLLKKLEESKKLLLFRNQIKLLGVL
jgi:CRP/FNR family transcriptional regulator